MVGISTGLCHDLDRFFHADSLLHQKADEFRDYHAWVGIVDLDGRIISQIMQITAALYGFVQDQVSGIADHEILLVNTEDTSGFVGVIRV